MKKFLHLLPVVLFIISCEEVIDVELPETETGLVVNGLLRVDISQEFVGVRIKVAETTNFFENNVPVQLDDNATIFYGEPNPDAPENIQNLASSSLTELEPGSGIYVPDPSFDIDQRIPTNAITPNTVFFLVLEYEERRYAARTPFSSTVPIDDISIGENTLFNEDDLELKVSFTDVAEEENFYVFDFGASDFLPLDDQFIDGQQFEFSYFIEGDFETGNEIEVSILGADQEFFNYMNLLIEQTEENGGVFETPAATVRGNVFEVTRLDNTLIFDNANRPESFALGYFAVVQEFKNSVTVD